MLSVCLHFNHVFGVLFTLHFWRKIAMNETGNALIDIRQSDIGKNPALSIELLLLKIMKTPWLKKT